MRPGLVKRALAVIGCAALAMTFAACESTEHESVQIEHESHAAAVAEQAKERATARRRAHGHVHAGLPESHGGAGR
ncbi:MAG: hypothetical protein ACHQHO_09550 [Solirubrobacterales bacterium]